MVTGQENDVASLRRLLAVALGVLLQLIGGFAIAYAIGRGVYYPFWAAHATYPELAQSWGGPSPVGATLVHWIIAGAMLAVGWLMFRSGRRWRHPIPQH